MDRVFVTGDTHGDLERIYKWVDKFDMNKSDIHIIIAGDAGICWRQDKKDMEATIEKQKQYNFHLWFIDGNHENFDILNSLEKNEVGIANLSNNLHYISRGSKLVFETENGVKSILCCGGADSIDREIRTPHLNWWRQEQITDNDIYKCLQLDSDFDIPYYDYIITHCCPYKIFIKYSPWLITLPGINQDKVDHTSEKKLNKIAEMVDCHKHIFGHYHIDKNFDDKYKCVFKDFIEL